ncbi:ParB/Srx family N-terminal domain-containing protein [Desulfotruncus alcoholivorax]|uniref:ParB/Srx family N-terminal domain-containing protein n=1 Tax=Desulfotruncus alcoholivorax TaxID=265477 RepID=UPI0004249329|nr:ParB/Srx family N-terminal domain-containing protein [Desulfotruncus alcoholivorax]
MPSEIVSPLILKLDTSNPRFLDAQIDEAGAIIYLLKYSKVAKLAESIVINGGLYIGERIVVLKNDDDTYTVLEGNRRTCACKLLLNRDLIPEGYQSVFPVANQTTINNINNIEVDVVSTKEEAERFIASRHVQSVELWSPIAKFKFFVDRFESGQTVQNIASSTQTPVGKVKQGIKEYKLLTCALNLPYWTSEQKQNKLNLFDLEADKYLRIFRTQGAAAAFGLSYDETYTPVSSLGQKVFNQIIQRIMYCAFITDNHNEKIDTRTKNWRNVPGLEAIVNAAHQSSTSEQSNDTGNQQNQSNTHATTGGSSNQSNTNPNQGGTTGTTAQSGSVGTTGSNNTQSGATGSQTQPATTGGTAQARPSNPTYSRHVLIPATCRLNIQLPKLHNIYTDLQRLNIISFTNSVAITFRVFFDLTIEEYLQSNNITSPRSNLASKFSTVLDDLVQKGFLQQRDANALRVLTSNNSQAPTILSITNFHDYVHRINYQPNPRDLIIIWDNFQKLMEIIYR